MFYSQNIFSFLLYQMRRYTFIFTFSFKYNIFLIVCRILNSLIS
uniref:Uncharacterized protein n=1 Tax=Myoviridae sp. ctjhW4 TaxID=2825162 RepID=A0A8S5PT62_9CAUD|nr:MAG TPA: hypothetical protein [Myoviridae sp. ctjhW4]